MIGGRPLSRVEKIDILFLASWCYLSSVIAIALIVSITRRDARRYSTALDRDE
jgi:hypothetical protein